MPLAGCGDDDGSVDGDSGPSDASMDGSPGPDDRDAAQDAGGDPRDAARDADPSADADAGASCPSEPFPLVTTEDEPWKFRRVSLDAYCDDARCPESLAGFTAGLTCHDLDDSGIDDFLAETDGGVDPSQHGVWARSEGCGSVQFSIVMSWPRYYNFDADTGELIGAARADDIFYEFAGCEGPGFVAGAIRHECADEVVTVCQHDSVWL